MEEVIKRLSKCITGKLQAPETVQIYPTNNCNLACLPCVSRGRPQFQPKEELSKATYLRIVKEATDLGVRRLDICGGGEPFMRAKVTLAIMKRVKNFGLKGTLSTNGTLFTKEMIKQIVGMGWDEIRFSINGPNNKIDDYIREFKGAFQKSINSVKVFIKYKKELKKEKPEMILAPVLCRYNFDKLNDIVKLGIFSGFDKLMLQPIAVPPNELGNKLKLNTEQQYKFKDYLKEVKKLAEKHNFSENFNQLDTNFIGESSKIKEIVEYEGINETKNSFLSIPCYQPWFCIAIHADGFAGPCPSIIGDTENIREKSLKEIWHGKYFKEFRQRMKNKNLHPLCRTCCDLPIVNNREIRDGLGRLR